MVLINPGELMSWEEIKQNIDIFRERAVNELLKIFDKFKGIQNDPFKWGDEVEFSLIKFDHKEKKAYLLLKALDFFNNLQNLKETDPRLEHVEFHNEYTNYMIETVPTWPNNDDFNVFPKLEANMKLRREIVQSFLSKDEQIISLTCFPMLGCLNFTTPSHKPTPQKKFNSLFISDDIILDIPLFKVVTDNKRERRNGKSLGYLPIFVDKNTPRPFIEDLRSYDLINADDNQKFVKPDQIYLDHDGFGMGCSCIQVTFQGESLNQACYLYDQLTPLAPIILALSASSPIWKGYLADVDCRWNSLKQVMDDRTREELGLEPLKNNPFKLKKSRFDTTEVYLSQEASRYNDFDLDKDNLVYEKLVSNGMHSQLALHFAGMFTRDPIFLFKDHLSNNDENFVMNFELFNCSNWRLLRFKPPPIKSESSLNRIGWRVEFRPTELQLTDFQNTAFATFIILLTRAIIDKKLNFLVNITQVDANMNEAVKRNACLEGKFGFRQNIYSNDDVEVREMSINQIINGSESFKGLVPIVKDYLKTVQITKENMEKVEKYLRLFEMRANGKLMTPASFMRKSVLEHHSYKQDSHINDEINYDLMCKLAKISDGSYECPELTPL